MRNYVRFYAVTAFVTSASGGTNSFNNLSQTVESMEDVVIYNFRRYGYDNGLWSLYFGDPTELWVQLSKETVLYMLQQFDAAYDGVEGSNLNFILDYSPRAHPDEENTFQDEILYLGQPVSPS